MTFAEPSAHGFLLRCMSPEWHEAGQSLCDGCPQLVEADIRAFGVAFGF